MTPNINSSFLRDRVWVARTSSSTSTRTYWRVRGWLSRWRMVVISASLMRLSWQSITLFRMVLRPPLLATTSGFFSATEETPDSGNYTEHCRLLHQNIPINSIKVQVCLQSHTLAWTKSIQQASEKPGPHLAHRRWRWLHGPCGLSPVFHRFPQQWES